MALSAAWQTLSTGLVPPAARLVAPPPGLAEPPKEDDLRAAVEVLRSHDLHSVLEEWFLEALQMDLQARIAPEFWNGIAQYENTATERQCSLLLLDAFSLLWRRLDPYLQSLGLMEAWTREGLLLGTGAQALRGKVHTMFRAILFFTTTQSFQEMIRRFYGRSFKIYMRQRQQWKGSREPQAGEAESSTSENEQQSEAEEMGEPPGAGRPCSGCSCEKERCWCPTALEQFQQLNSVLWVPSAVCR